MGKRKDSTNRPLRDHGVKPEPEPASDSSADSEEFGISLEELGNSYAQMLGTGSLPYQEPTSADSEADVESPMVFDAVAEELVESDECPITPLSILEAILFVGRPDNSPVDAEAVAGLMRGVRSAEIEQLVNELNGIYEEQGHVFRIVASGEGYRLQLGEQYMGVCERFYGTVRQVKLTQAAIDCLAIIAYRPGITRQELDEQRGQASGAILNQLVRRELVQMRRDGAKKDSARRYYATQRMLKLVGIDSLDELPLAEDFER